LGAHIAKRKSARQIITVHEIQLVSSLVASGNPVRVVLDFAEQKLDVNGRINMISKNPVHPVILSKAIRHRICERDR
jgi:hypothetical protein